MIDAVITPRMADLGHGLVVRRLLPSAARRSVGPFVFFDHAGPVVLAPETARQADVRPHPHIGLATVSYLLSGSVTHRDGLGLTQAIRPGDVNWMTAGRGISHSERFDDPAAFAGAGLELLQSWVALPEADEEMAPAFDHYPQASLPLLQRDGLWLRLIAGSAFGLSSPVRTRSPVFYAHARLEAGATLTVPVTYAERAAYVLCGEVECDGQRHAAGRMLVFHSGTGPTMCAVKNETVGSEIATVMLLGGEALGPRHLWWNFVSSRAERIEQAKADWQSGAMALPPHDRDEFIPLPEPR